MKYLVTIFSLVTLMLALAGGAQANGYSITLDKPVGEYIANLDHDAVGGIFVGTPVQFAFQLFTKDRSQSLNVDDVWVTITPAGTSANYTPPVLDVGIVGSPSSIVPPGLAFAFPSGGSYDMKIRFDKAGKTLAEATFPLTVKGAEEKTVSIERTRLLSFFLLGALSVLVVFALVWMFRKEPTQ